MQLRQQQEAGQQGQGKLAAQVSQLQEALQKREQEAKQWQQELTAAQREAQAARTESQQGQARQQEATQQLQQAQADLERVKTEATATRTRLEAEVAQRTTEAAQARARYEQLQRQVAAGKQPPEQIEQQRQRQAQDNAKRGMEALAGGHCVEAVASLQKAFDLDPSLKEIKKLFASALQCQAASLPDKQSKEYETLLLQSVALDAESVEGYYQLGNLYLNRKNNPKAIESYKKAVKLDPEI